MKIIKVSIVLLSLLIVLALAVSCNTAPESNCYENIIEKYNELVKLKVNGDSLTAPDESAEDFESVLYNIVNSHSDASNMGYATKDINGDGLDELVLMDKNNKLYALFTQSDNVNVLLLEMGSPAAISPDGTIYSYNYIKNEIETTIVKRIVGDKLEGIEFGGIINDDTVSYYKIENGLRSEITYEEKSYLDASVQNIIQSSPYVTKTCGFRFIPSITENQSENTGEVFDFSSYDKILSAYKNIVGNFSEFTKEKWIKGEYDSLYNFNDNESYDVFHCIFYQGIIAKPTKTNFGFDYAENGNNAYGYSKKDLNGDGVEELILLTNDYDIIAIFTIYKNKAVMLKGVSGGWIDNNGRIYIEKSTGGVVGRDGEAYLYEIKDGSLNCVIGVGYKVNVYLEKEGWYKIENGEKINVSSKEGEEMYSKFDVIPNRYSSNEYIRSVADLKFLPVFEKSLAENIHANKYVNSYFVGGSSVIISAVSDDSVTFSFECIKTVGDFVPETEQEIYKTTISGKAVLKEGRYEFDIDGIKGYLDFSVNSVWVIVTESGNDKVEAKAYLFNYRENN